MLTKEQARHLAFEEVTSKWNIKNDEPVILDKDTIEREFGWVFFYTSRKFIETKKFEYTLLGNAPIIVNKFDGSLHYTGTAYETEYYIAKYEEKLKNGTLN